MAKRNFEPSIKIVGDIANTAVAVKQKLTPKDLKLILTLFNQKSSDGLDYALPGRLIQKAVRFYRENRDTETADNIQSVFTKKDVNLLK